MSNRPRPYARPTRAQARAFAQSGPPTGSWRADRAWRADPFLSLLAEFMKPVPGPGVVLDWRGGDVRLPAPHVVVEGRARPVQGMAVPAPGAPAPVPPTRTMPPTLLRHPPLLAAGPKVPQRPQ